MVSLMCAALALLIARVVFGPLGITAGMVAVWKGDVWWGGTGVWEAVEKVRPKYRCLMTFIHTKPRPGRYPT